MFCAVCRKKYPWYRSVCPECNRMLVRNPKEDAEVTVAPAPDEVEGSAAAPEAIELEDVPVDLAREFAAMEQALDATESRGVSLSDVASGRPLGRLTAGQFAVLQTALEEESSTDDDYYINAATLEMLEAQGADAGMIDILRRALGDRDGLDIRWTRD